MGVLDDLVARASARAQRLRPPEHRVMPPGEPLASALRGKEELSVIAEFKRASPSEGEIAARNLEEQVALYEDAGAAAVSVLTEPSRFNGSYEDLARAARAVSIPILMKDFVVDPVQVGHAASLGASGVLLIVRCLSKAQLRELVLASKESGLTALVECHDEAEVELAISLDGVVIGVNNRNLDTLDVDTGVAPRLLARVPPDRITVAESGYATERDVRNLHGLADAVLVGTALMKHRAPQDLIEAMRR
ncbi:MAG TPA: indole-3-glycerol-phosphate synthase [Vicinamibacteria bacterium]|nr:indole-3-glycerol-phosphate synthase [Vicinamibacteria bacterium]